MISLMLAPRSLTVFALCALLLIAFAAEQRTTSNASSQSGQPAGVLSELSVDDGVGECALGPALELQGQPGFGWSNKLTPSSYPATLRTITVGFNRTGPLVEPDKQFRIVVFLDPEDDGPANGQEADATFIARVRGGDPIMVYNLISPVTIASGAFVVGVIDDFAVASPDEHGNSTFPALMDIPGTSTPSGSASFFTNDAGATWTVLSDLPLPGPDPCSGPGSFIIRGTVESAPVETLSVTRIQDPAAVEPFAVAVNATGSEAFVANYVSDNLTVITTSNNNFSNVAVGDGPGGAADGPFGIASHPDGTKIYVGLFGSNTIPSKEFPVDATALADGRVSVLTKAGGTYSQTATITVGRGPMTPSISHDGSKLFVPCNGSAQVDVIDTRTNQRVTTIPVNSGPSSCTLSIDGLKVYVTHLGSQSITVIDSRTNQKIGDIAVPVDGILPSPILENAWSAAVAPATGNLYVAFWGTTAPGAPSQHGGIGVIDTCRDVFIRAIIDDTGKPTEPGSDGASGIAAPTEALTRDPVTGLTPGAGGGGGGAFGVSASSTEVVFTNDGRGIVGVLDSRIDQVVSAPALAVASSPKPRGVASTRVGNRHTAYVASGQPDNGILIVSIPDLPENLPNVPVINSVLLLDGKVEVSGSSFSPVAELEMLGVTSSDGTACLGFKKDAKVKKGIRIIQKGKLDDGRTVESALGTAGRVFVRVVNPDGEVRAARCCAVP
jgi:YVTN family beta-propeller protein